MDRISKATLGKVIDKNFPELKIVMGSQKKVSQAG